MKPILTTMFILWGISACSAPSYPGRVAAGAPKSDDSSLGDIAEQPLEKVSVFDLDGTEFRVTGVRAGLQDFLRGETPALFYNLPERADYVEVLRCKADTVLRGAFDDLSDVELGNPGLDGEALAFQHNNFWNAAAAQTNQCVMVSTGFTGKVFLDADVATGSYRYLVRACVSPEKLADGGYGLSRSCSRQVALSPILADFQNRRAQKQQKSMASLQQFRDRVDGLGRELHYLAVELNNAYARCQKTEEERELRLKRKESLLRIMGLGISLGMEIALPEEGLAAVQAGQKSWKQLWSETWEARDDIAGAGAQVGTVLGWLFSSTRDFPRSCTEARELGMKAATKTAELKNVHQELAQALDSAETAAGQGE